MVTIRLSRPARRSVWPRRALRRPAFRFLRTVTGTGTVFNYHRRSPPVTCYAGWLSGNLVNLPPESQPGNGSRPGDNAQKSGLLTDWGFFPGLFQQWFLCGRRVHPVSRQPAAYPASRRCPAYRAVNGLASFFALIFSRLGTRVMRLDPAAGPPSQPDRRRRDAMPCGRFASATTCL